MKSKPSSATVNTFLSWLENPLLRMVLRLAGDRHLRNGDSYLKAALDDIAEESNSEHSLTRTVFSGIIKTVVNLGCATFNVDRTEAVDALKVPHFRKGLVNVLNGIGKYGVTRPYKTYAPFLVVWNYTNACNLRCRHCYQRADKQTPDELTTEERFKIVDQLDENNVSAVAFSGGEPLMRRDFFEVARHAYNKGMYVSLATNGTLLTTEVLKQLKKSGVEYAEISLDGATKETHDAFRGINGAFERTVQGIKNAVKSELFTCIAVTATKHNINEMPKIVKLGKELGADRIIIFNFIPTGRGKEIISLDISPVEREDLLQLLYQELTYNEIQIICTAPQYARVCMEQSLRNKKDIYAPTHFAAQDFDGKTKELLDFLGGCGAGRLYCAIQPNGLVTPCVFLPIVVGDLRKRSLKEIWDNSKVMNDLRDRSKLQGRCGHCEYKNFCGGCRARAYAYYENYLAPDPGCIKELEEPSISFAPKKTYSIEPAEPEKMRAEKQTCLSGM
jgi:radical SAM protein with 4Fe4S-binding SPASM domain